MRVMLVSLLHLIHKNICLRTIVLDSQILALFYYSEKIKYL